MRRCLWRERLLPRVRSFVHGGGSRDGIAFDKNPDKKPAAEVQRASTKPRLLVAFVLSTNLSGLQGLKCQVVSLLVRRLDCRDSGAGMGRCCLDLRLIKWPCWLVVFDYREIPPIAETRLYDVLAIIICTSTQFACLRQEASWKSFRRHFPTPFPTSTTTTTTTTVISQERSILQSHRSLAVWPAP